MVSLAAAQILVCAPTQTKGVLLDREILNTALLWPPCQIYQWELWRKEPGVPEEQTFPRLARHSAF